MRRTIAAAVPLLLWGCASVGPIADTRTVTLRDAEGRTVGTALLAPERDGVRVVLSINGIPPGTHGVHLHERGRCEPPDFASAGGHFNPAGRQHGTENPAGPHAGDLPNLEVDGAGRGVEVDGAGRGALTAVARGVALRGGGAASLLRAGGTSLVVHASADDYATDPSGGSGDRIACGVVAAG